MKDGPGPREGDRIAAAILVGGASRRLGRDKAREPVGGIPLVERVAVALSSVVPEVFLVGKEGQQPPLPGCPFFPDREPGRSALAGLDRAIGIAAERDLLLVAGCDLPFLSPALLARLLRVPEERPALVPRIRGRPEPLVACWRPRLCRAVLSRRLAEGRFRLSEALSELRPAWLEEAEAREADPGLRSFVNVNDARDLEEARILDEKV